MILSLWCQRLSLGVSPTISMAGVISDVKYLNIGETGYVVLCGVLISASNQCSDLAQIWRSLYKDIPPQND